MASVKKNFAYNIVYQIFTLLMPLITAPYLARVIGASGLGIYTYTFTIAEYFVLFCMLGVNNYGNRTIASATKEKKDEIFINIYMVQLTISIIVIAIYIIYASYFNQAYRYYSFLQLIYVISGGLDINWYFFGTEQFKITTIRNVMIKCLTLMLIIIFVKDVADTWIYIIIMATSYLLSQLIMWRVALGQIKFVKPNLQEMKNNIKPMLILFIPVIAVSLYKMMDKIMLGSFIGVEEVGYYDNAAKIVTVPSMVITALGTAMLPRMAKLNAKGEQDKILTYISSSMEFVGCMASAMCFGLIAVADELIPIYYGSGFLQCVPILKALCITLIFTSWANVIRTQYLIPMQHDKAYIVSVFVGAVSNLILNILFIKSMGAIGAVIATIIAEASVALIQTLYILKKLPIKQYLRRYIVYLIPGIIMCVIVKYIGSIGITSIVHLILCIVIGATIYLLMCIGYWYISKNEVLIIFQNNICKKKR